MIYFIGPEWPNLVKIGHADSMRVRYSQLQVYSPFELKIHGVCEGDTGDEKDFHERFRDLWHRGEWFRFERPIREFVRDHCQTWSPDNDERAPGALKWHTGNTFFVGCEWDFHERWLLLANSHCTSIHNIAMLACEAYARTKGFEPPPAREIARNRPPRSLTPHRTYGISVRSEGPWVAWVARFAKSEKMTVSKLARHSIELFEKNQAKALDL